MDLHAYHRALNLGFSESEASRIGDDAWENNRQQPTCDPEPEPDYYDVLVAENTRLLATISRLREYAGHNPACTHWDWVLGASRSGDTCDCGYDALLAALEETK
jgi:hypothetical protein